MTQGYLGLGSNVGDRRAHLLQAAAELPRHGIQVCASSSVYETEPVGLVLHQRYFFNACVSVETAHGPEQLLAACKAAEREVGRAPGGVRHGPRVIDVDLLLLEGIEYRSARLALPHPEILTRRFVLVPLLELDRKLALPGSGQRLVDALVLLRARQEVKRVGPPLV